MFSIDLPKRKSPRIPGYNYASVNYYFITICTHEKKCIFGIPGKLNWMGKYAEECLIKIPEVYPDIRLENYIVMPNHVHAIFNISQENQKNGLAKVIGQYKMSVTKGIRAVKPEIQVWQRSFHDHIIRNEKSYQKIWNYIEYNPLKWDEDCFYMKNENQ